ncbi:MAG TPA: type III-A CRISPR-associated protein Csm2 [Bacilli bacterium]|nr:type III-A CRISPR-associated protein Csm2 [Bacilli bacterium]
MNKYYSTPKNNQSPIDNIINVIKDAKNLSKVLTVKAISLPGAYAHTVAKNLRNTKNNQIRKFFEIVKKAETEAVNDNLINAKNILFSLVPQVAYSVGRELCDKKLYELIASCIKDEKLQNKEDVEMFAKFFEAIVAYGKFENTLKN